MSLDHPFSLFLGNSPSHLGVLLGQLRDAALPGFQVSVTTPTHLTSFFFFFNPSCDPPILLLTGFPVWDFYTPPATLTPARLSQHFEEVLFSFQPGSFEGKPGINFVPVIGFGCLFSENLDFLFPL